MKRRRRNGFTLIEAVAVIALVGVIAAGLAPIIIAVVDVWELVSFREERGAEARIAIDWMKREMRETKDTSSILTADTSEFRFYDAADNDIRYHISGGSLYRNNNILAGNIQSLAFRYYNSSNTQLSTPVSAALRSAIRRIEIDLTISAGRENLTLSSGIYLRNFL
ncbi:MAG: type II secretion system protein [Candidatus Omnitrophica bacterium]|nr:type II secretion system protein [Candidatus Omnitrophota bacterium]